MGWEALVESARTFFGITEPPPTQHRPRPGVREAWVCYKCLFRLFGRQGSRPKCDKGHWMDRQANTPYNGMSTE